MMTLNKMMNELFERQSVETWKQKAEETLKGKLFESLTTNTYENLKLKPLYSMEDFEGQRISQYPGQSDFRRGSEALGYLSEEWKIAQKLVSEDGENLRKKLLESFDKGQTAISIRTDKLNINDFGKIVDDIYLKYPFSMETNEHQAPLLTQLSKLTDSDKVTGYIAADPLAKAAITGNVVEIESYDEWGKIIQLADRNMPGLRTILIDTSVYHNGGANAVQELAIAISTGSYHIQQLLERGVSLETILTKMIFKFSMGANFFMEIAKLRAARIIWSKVAETYGAKAETRKMVITAETSTLTKTAYDPYVNMLRTGNEAFSAVLGGIQYLHVQPFNEPEGKPTAFSERIARNMQLILKEEVHLKKIIDPAGGSWYVESLTNELAQKAWELFLEIEERDGMAEVLKSGWIQEQISKVLKKRNEDIFTRKQSIIGTNIYANLNDKPLQSKNEQYCSERKSLAIPQVRLSEPFEKLRRAAKELENIGGKPSVGLICLGKLKEHKARADFMTGFLAPGGIYAVKSPEIVKAEDALKFVSETNFNHYAICGTNDQYDEAALETTCLIKENRPDATLFLAGIPENSKQESLQHAGIKQFIHVRSNCYEVLSSLLSEMEVATNGEKTGF